MRAALRLALGIGVATVSLSAHSLSVGAATTAEAAKNVPVTTTTVESAEAPPMAPAVKKVGAWDEVNERMSRIERRIVEAVSAGRLPSVQAKSLRNELDRIAEMQAVFRALPVTTAHWHNQALNFELDVLTESLERAMHDRDIVPAELDFLKDDTLRRIDTAARQGRLNSNEVANLKQELNRITALEHMLARQQGKLTYTDKLMLAIDLDHLSASLRRQMSERTVAPFDVNEAVAAVEKRTEDAVKSATIPGDVAAAIRSQLAEIKATASKNGDQSKTRDSKSIIATGLWIESVSNRLDEQIQRAKKMVPDFEERSQIDDARIAAALVDGRLTPMEALELKEDLEFIRAEYAKLKTAGAPKAEEEFAFQLSLARLEGLVDRQLHGPSLIWSGVPAYHAHLDTRIKEALAAGRLTAEQAKALDSDSDFQAAKMRALGGLPRIKETATALDLSIGLQQLSAKIDKAMKDRTMAAADIESLHSAIDQRIGHALITGQLNLDEGRSMSEKLSQVETLRDQYKNSDAELTAREKWQVAYELQETAADLEELVHDHPALFPGVEVRRAQIDELVNEGLSSGRFTLAEAESIRALITQNQDTERALVSSGPGFTANQAIALVMGLERQHDRLERQLRERQVPTSDLVAKEGQVERKIAHFFSLGYLTPAEAENLRSQYNSVVTALRHMRGAGGGLSYGERLAFLYGLERLSATVERSARTVPLPLPNVTVAQKDLENRIGAALASGRLPVQEAMDLKSLVDELTLTTSRARSSGGGLSYPEALVGVVDVQRLGRRLQLRIAAVKQPLPDIDARQADLEKRIQNARANGKLNAEQISQLKADLDRIAEGEVAYRLSEESLNFMEAVNLVQDLDRVNKRLDELVRSKLEKPKTTASDKVNSKLKKNL